MYDVDEDFFLFCFVIIAHVLCLREYFQFQEVLFIIAALSVCASDVIFRKLSSMPMCSRLHLMFSSIGFSVTGLMEAFGPPELEFCAWR